MRIPDLAILLVSMVLTACVHPPLKSENADDRLLHLVCEKDVVMLGENSHGDGSTIAIRAQLVPRLVKECGFSAIVFESSFYDMAELRNRTRHDQMYDEVLFKSAVGGLWSSTVEFEPLADWIATQSPDTVKIAGMDPQLGSAGAFFSLEAMPRELVAVLPEDERDQCFVDMKGWIGWSTDRGEAQPRIAACLDRIDAALAASEKRQGLAAEYVKSFREVLSWTGLEGADLVMRRDRAMAARLEEFTSHLARGEKVIVWTANAHAAYGGLNKGLTVAQITKKSMGERLISVGFTAAGGSFRWSRNEVREIEPAEPGDLERIILGEKERALADHAKLVSIGKVRGTALNWHKRQDLDWSQMFDAIYVLAEERPKTLTVVN